MPNCAVYGCKSHNKMKGEAYVKFYKFPKDENLAMQWSNASCREDNKINMKYAVICSKHFESKCFFTPLKYKLLNENMPKRFRNLIDTAIPTLLLPKDSTTSTNIPNNNCTKRMHRLQEKNNLEKGKTLIADIMADQNDNCYNLSESHDQLGAESIIKESLADRMEVNLK